VDPEAAEMLSLQMLKGNRSGLQHAGLLISSSVAKAIFGETDPLGKTIRIDGNGSAQVSGVYEDFPQNSDFKDLSFIAPLSLYLAYSDVKSAPNPWLYQDRFIAYVQLKPGVDMEKTSLKIKNIRKGKIPDANYNTDKPTDFLHPMAKWHLYSGFENVTGYAVREKIEYVRLLSVIGIFVLLLACINFMNLSTARSEKRAREVGVRKTIGSYRYQLINQFLIESLLAVSMAFLLSLLWVALILPRFNILTEKQLTIPWGNPGFWAVVLCFNIFTGLVSGLYPAFYLSSFKPVKVLSGVFRSGPMAGLLRRVLVVFQFTVSAGLIICTIVIYQQIQFVYNRSLGYDRSGLIMITETPDVQKNFTAIREELRKSNTVMEVVGSQNSTTDYNIDENRLSWEGKDPNANADMAFSNTTYGYGKAIGWQILEGRDFSPDYPTDSTAFILNEAAVKQMGFKHPIGKIVQWQGKPFHVIGVIKNIIFESPYTIASSPSIFHMAGGTNYVCTIKLNPAIPVQQALAKIRSVFARYNPAYPFEYHFVDQEYAKKFSDEYQIGKLSGLFTLLAIFISCLGLFGMASFMAEQRKKEIAVRKVLGASVFNLWRLLSKDYLLLVFISLLIASPVAYYFMNHWLRNYEYRTMLSAWIFGAAGAGALVITLCTVSFQSVKAALSNPVTSLRSE
jgi:ABC-type antimicrobial peptide transport system permease subunit